MRHWRVWVGVGAITVAATARASELPPWIEAGDFPVQADVASVLAIHDEVRVEANPSAAGPRRGTLAQGVAYPLFAFKRGPGCNGRWISVGPLAWVCEDHLRLATAQPIAAKDHPSREMSDGLPYRYYFVGRGGSSGYSDLAAADQTSPDQDLEPGFAVAIVEERSHHGETFGRSHHGLWIPMRDLAPVRSNPFRGETLLDGKLDFGWVVGDDVRGYSTPAPGARSDRRFSRFQRVRILEEKTVRRDKFLRVDERAWLHERDVRHPSIALPPSEVAEGERWIDIDLSSQTAVAYEGTIPVYVTLVSTGKGPAGSSFATPRGAFRIWVKLTGSTMDNLEDEEATNYYSIEDVPYVQYFAGGVGLHGAFWHSGFGRVRSHGCVNLSPVDARWLFDWTSPHLPAGWTAVLPTDLEPGTIVRVR